MCRTACSSPPLLKTSKNLKEHIITNWAILLIWEILRCLRILKVVQESRSTQWLRTIRRPEPTNWALWARDLQLRYEHGYCQGTSLTVLSLAQAPRSSSHVMHRDEVKTQPNWSFPIKTIWRERRGTINWWPWEAGQLPNGGLVQEYNVKVDRRIWLAELPLGPGE